MKNWHLVLIVLVSVVFAILSAIGNPPIPTKEPLVEMVQFIFFIITAILSFLGIDWRCHNKTKI